MNFKRMWLFVFAFAVFAIPMTQMRAQSVGLTSTFHDGVRPPAPPKDGVRPPAPPK